MPAPEGNNYAEGHGRPTDYRPEYDEQAYKLCLLGHTDAELAGFFGVAESTVNLWKQEHLSFSESVRRGKDIADAEVAASFFKRATGYRYEEVTFEKIDDKITLEISPNALITQDAYKKKVVTKELPPDAGAALNWLKNRKPKKWRDKQVVEVQNTISEEDMEALNDDQIEALLSLKKVLRKRNEGTGTTD